MAPLGRGTERSRDTPFPLLPRTHMSFFKEYIFFKSLYLRCRLSLEVSDERGRNTPRSLPRGPQNRILRKKIGAKSVASCITNA